MNKLLIEKTRYRDLSRPRRRLVTTRGGVSGAFSRLNACPTPLPFSTQSRARSMVRTPVHASHLRGDRPLYVAGGRRTLRSPPLPSSAFRSGRSERSHGDEQRASPEARDFCPSFVRPFSTTIAWRKVCHAAVSVATAGPKSGGPALVVRVENGRRNVAGDVAALQALS
jgi:hypothetical protein